MRHTLILLFGRAKEKQNVTIQGARLMTTYKLTYFDFDGGRAEPVRIAFHAAGVEFEDHRITFPEFGEMRSKFRFTAVPVLEVDGAAVTQSNGMLRYIGKQGGLYPEDNLQALYCDEALGVVEDAYHKMSRTFFLEGDALKQARQEFIDNWLTLFLKGLDEMLSRGGGQYFADNRLTVADLKVFIYLRHLISGNLDHVPADLVEKLAPALAQHHSRIEADPVVAAYYSSRS
jgi:glutathione S-transferase